MNLDISFRLKPVVLDSICDTFPISDRSWPNVIAGTKDQKNLTSILMPLARKLITKSNNWHKKDNASKSYRLTLRYYEAQALETWLSYNYMMMPYGCERNHCYSVCNTLNQLTA